MGCDESSIIMGASGGLCGLSRAEPLSARALELMRRMKATRVCACAADVVHKVSSYLERCSQVRKYAYNKYGHAQGHGPSSTARYTRPEIKHAASGAKVTAVTFDDRTLTAKPTIPSG
jgi:hypothetical protein